MGKKYIIELEEVPFIQHFKNGAWETIYRVKGFNSLVFDWNGLNMLTPYTEPDLDKVKADAYNDGYDVGHKDGREAEKVRQPDLDQVRKEVYDKCMDEAEMTAYKLYSPKIDEAYQRGLADAWEAARKIYGSATKHGLPTEVITKIFRDDGKENFNYWDIVEDFSPAEAIEKIQQYEQAQKEKEEQEEKDSVTAEEVMRQYLDIFCKSKWCSGCPLNTPDFTCGRGYHFLGSSPISDEEVRRAYATVLQKIEEN